ARNVLRSSRIDGDDACPPAEPHSRLGWAPAAGDRTRPSMRAIAPSPDEPTAALEPQSEQAYIPAEQPSSPQEARLPAAHAHSRRTGHPAQPAQQGPRPHRGLTTLHSAAVRKPDAAA